MLNNSLLEDIIFVFVNMLFIFWEILRTGKD